MYALRGVNSSSGRVLGLNTFEYCSLNLVEIRKLVHPICSYTYYEETNTPRVIFCLRWSFIQSCSRHDGGSGTQVFWSETKVNLSHVHCSDWLRGSHQMREFLVIPFFSLEANCQSLAAGLCNAMALWTGWCHLWTGYGGSEGNINLILCVAGIQLETEILNLIWGYKASRIRNNFVCLGNPSDGNTGDTGCPLRCRIW